MTSRSTLPLLAALLAAQVFGSAVHAQSAASADWATHRGRLSLVTPKSVDAGTTVVFMVQTEPHVWVGLRVAFSGTSVTYRRRAGKRGQARFLYVTPNTTQAGTLQVVARATVARHHLSVTKTVSLRPFLPQIGIQQVQVLTQGPTGWTPTTQVRLGENVRFVASYGVTEPAGNIFPSCVSGVLRVVRSSSTLFSAPVQCPQTQPANSLPYVYVDERFSDTSAIGPLSAQFDLTYDEGQYGVAQGEGTTSFSLLPDSFS